MSNALKCDRCGKLYEEYGGIRQFETGKSYCRFAICGKLHNELYDLCEDCMSSLLDWIKEKNNERN